MTGRPRNLVLALAMLTATPAWARSEKTLAYPRDQVWPTAVRFLVVDEHLKVIEKDADAGFVTFELRDEGRTFRGALEVMTINRDGRSLVRFVLQIEDRPSWLEIAMLGRLETKLRAELGSPVPAPSERPKDKGGDKPADKADDKPADKGGDKPADDHRDEGPRISPTP